jgi:hypothetical protein
VLIDRIANQEAYFGDWQVAELECGHCIMLDLPEQLAAALLTDSSALSSGRLADIIGI